MILRLALISTVVSTMVHGGTTRGTRQRRMLLPDQTVTVTGECTYLNVIQSFESQGYQSEVLGNEVTVTTMCEDARDAAYTEVSYHDITQDYQFTKNYFDGGTEWNHGSDLGLAVDAARAHRFATHSANSRRLEFPKGPQGDVTNVISNFQSCQHNTVMCCYVDGASTKNTDVCSVDLNKAPYSNHVANGYSVFNAAVDDTTYCEGFQWDQDDASITNLFKGNTLFELSINKNLGRLDNGETPLTKNVPGAPMCACIEQMPVVTEAKCTKVVEAYSFTKTVTGSYTAKLDLQYIDCGALSNVSEYVVGANQCDSAVQKFVSNKGYKRGQAWWYADEDMWQPIIGRGNQYWYPMSADDLEGYLSNSNVIIWRVCTSCQKSHRNIYYKRLTPVADAAVLLETLLNNWTNNDNNEIGIDFNLYSTLDDAFTNQNEWKFCNFNKVNIGFPAECGPEESTPNMWNSFTKKGGYAKHVAFYIAKQP